MTRASRSRQRTSAPADAIDLSDDLNLFDYVVEPAVGKPRAKSNRRRWRPVITDDLPEDLPVTKADLDRYELYFADFLDEIFGPRPHEIQSGPAFAAKQS